SIKSGPRNSMRSIDVFPQSPDFWHGLVRFGPCRFFVSVEDDADRLARHEAFAGHGVDFPEKPGNAVRLVDEFVYHREVFREAPDFRRVYAAVRAESQRAAEDSRPCQPAAAGLLDDHFVQGAAFVFIALADVNPQSLGFGGKFHGAPAGGKPKSE